MIRIRGELVCADAAESDAVDHHLPEHAERTRAEPGCLAFEVVPTADPLVWRVDELFRDDDAVGAHRERMDGSAWARATAGIERRYAQVVTEAETG
ncbi:putative quinol monooxygenase [Clavibacter tessellarius]|uniref:ABM domain-containing protein n=1 Tax=Clavibacter tessellarius TaxID=31965 RepID=A0A154V5B3_9MICO|nr:antibiotic biosynthesis monooxygenase [Clavibacter michiganensis]KZC96552.1 hypothetical protein AWH51_02305 [Clavibacter michiganensis subsp. tessellarius]